MSVALIKLLLVLLVFVVPVILKMIGGVREQAGGPPAGPRPVRRPRPSQKPLEDEVGEFLRQATTGRRKPPSPAQPPAARTTTRRPQPQQPAERPVEAEVVSQPLGGDIGRHVRKFLDSGEFGRRSAEMGEKMAQADQAMDQRMQDVFEHKVGQLGGSPEVVAGGASAVGPSVAPGDMLRSAAVGELIQALCRPENIRQAIIINEILQRPESRWS